MKHAHVIGGGTHFHVRPHLSLSAPAHGNTARFIHRALLERSIDSKLHLTRMAGGEASLDTNQDIARLLGEIIEEPSPILFLPVALTDFTASVIEEGAPTPSGKLEPRLKSRNGPVTLHCEPAEKLIASIRKERKDVYLVGFKASAGATPEEQFALGLELLKHASCNLVLSNDVRARRSMIITPEESAYAAEDRARTLEMLVEMAIARSNLHFTRSTIVPGEAVGWSSPLIPTALRRVVDHCIARGAYKPFLGRTVGHFAARLDDGTFLTSRRKTDFNHLAETGLVQVETRGTDRVIARGFRPSVGGQSQRIVFAEHPETDCIVHFHCPMRPGSRVPVRSQRPFECGSHECGENTSRGLASFELESGTKILAVMLDQHGPNIVFSRKADPEAVIRFIEENFELEKSTSGPALERGVADVLS